MVDYENGKVLLPIIIAQRVCEKYGVNFNWLMTGLGRQRMADILSEAQSRRAEVEAQEALRAIRQIVEKYCSSPLSSGLDRNRPNDLFSAALRLALGRLERDFKERRGLVQIASFIEDLIVTARDLLSEELGLIAASKREEMMEWSHKVSQRLFHTSPGSPSSGTAGGQSQQERQAKPLPIRKRRVKQKGGGDA